MSSVAVSTVLDDAEKIAEELVPPVAAVPRVLAVVVQHLNEFAKSNTGKELIGLGEDILGIAPPPAADQASAAEASTDPAVLAKLAELQTEIDKLKAGGA